MNGRCVLIVGPSAAGKTQLVATLLTRIPHSTRLVTTTTRSRRPEEKDDYFFISKQTFEQGIKEGDFFEYAEVYGNLYGTSKKVLEEYRKKFDYVFAIIDVQGAQTLRSKIPDSFSIFISPGSVEDTHRRLKLVRHDISAQELQKRLDTATYELSLASTFDVVVENKDGKFNEAVAEIETILKRL